MTPPDPLADPLEDPLEDPLAGLLPLAPPPVARAQFRDALRRRFVGAEARQEEPGAAPPHAARFADESEARPAAPPPERRGWRLVSMLAAAAAVVLMFFWPSEEQWRVGPSSDYVRVRIAGESLGANEAGRLVAALRPGALIEVEGGTLELVLDRRAAFSLAPGTRAMLVELPARRALGDIVIDQDRGSVAVVTGPEFEGLGLSIRTPFADVRVLGTEFAVDVFPGSGTCVCCAEGRVGVDEHGREREDPTSAEPRWTVPGGKLGFVSPAGELAAQGEAEADHLAPLRSLRRAWD